MSKRVVWLKKSMFEHVKTCTGGVGRRGAATGGIWRRSFCTGRQLWTPTSDHVHPAFSYFFTILCFLLFINALNMFDGINLQVGCYSLIVCIILISNGIFSDLNLILIFSLLIFLFYNYKNKI